MYVNQNCASDISISTQWKKPASQFENEYLSPTGCKDLMQHTADS